MCILYTYMHICLFNIFQENNSIIKRNVFRNVAWTKWVMANVIKGSVLLWLTGVIEGHDWLQNRDEGDVTKRKCRFDRENFI